MEPITGGGVYWKLVGLLGLALSLAFHGAGVFAQEEVNWPPEVVTQIQSLSQPPTGFSWRYLEFQAGDRFSLAEGENDLLGIAFLQGVTSPGKTSGGPNRLMYAQTSLPAMDYWLTTTVQEGTNLEHADTSIKFNSSNQPQIAYNVHDPTDFESLLKLKLSYLDSATSSWKISDIGTQTPVYRVSQEITGDLTHIILRADRLYDVSSVDKYLWQIAQIDSPSSIIYSFDTDVFNNEKIGVANTHLSQGLFFSTSNYNGSSWETTHIDDSAAAIGPSLSYGPRGNPSVSYSSGRDLTEIKLARYNQRDLSWRLEEFPFLLGGPTKVLLDEHGNTCLLIKAGRQLYLAIRGKKSISWKIDKLVDADLVGQTLGDDIDMLLTSGRYLVVGYTQGVPGRFGGTDNTIRLAVAGPIPNQPVVKLPDINRFRLISLKPIPSQVDLVDFDESGSRNVADYLNLFESWYQDHAVGIDR